MDNKKELIIDLLRILEVNGYVDKQVLSEVDDVIDGDVDVELTIKKKKKIGYKEYRINLLEEIDDDDVEFIVDGDELVNIINKRDKNNLL
mgnify:CR=1 FL=1